MSFRIKPTHSSLDQSQQVKTEEKTAISFFDIPDEKDTFTTPTYTVASQQQQNAPKGSDSKGMAIRQVASAQADHM